MSDGEHNVLYILTPTILSYSIIYYTVDRVTDGKHNMLYIIVYLYSMIVILYSGQCD